MDKPNKEELESRYRESGTDDLVDLVAGGGLTPEAKELAHKELADRGIDYDVYQSEREKSDAAEFIAARPGYGTDPDENVFARLWQGDVPLPIAFWIVYWVGGFVALFVGAAIAELSGLVGGFVLISGGYTVYSLIVLWRSTKRYQGPNVWRNGAQFFVIIAWISFILLLIEMG
ncbi:hypothetical protein J2T60_001391 [Natronospira proteinivora]|uniref:Uncharacterized protein n=1 Tax=Natronospira proteinivora TaxID=1807133 RepID=A0ABT1G870_9GAMM|nr:hypothetical protein [Natronospira proteinivora]MCP1727426.1 hypothetical protein [Natronospira proteinivora]